MKKNIFIFLLLFVFALSVSNVSGEQFDESKIMAENNLAKNVNYVQDEEFIYKTQSYNYNLNYECNNNELHKNSLSEIKINEDYSSHKCSSINQNPVLSPIKYISHEKSQCEYSYENRVDKSIIDDCYVDATHYSYITEDYSKSNGVSGGVGGSISVEESDIIDCNAKNYFDESLYNVLVNDFVKLESELNEDKIYPESNDVIFVSNLTKYYGSLDKLNISLMDYKNTGIANANVSITINNKTYIKLTDEFGKIQMNINLNSGNYTVNAKYNQVQSNASIKILPTLNANNITKIYKNSTQYYATFTDANGNYLAHKTSVNFNINGIRYTRYIEGNDGKAMLNLNLEQGNYMLTAINTVTNENIVNNIIILPSIVGNIDLVKYYKNDSSYDLRILDNMGESQKSGVEVTFNINGVFYTRTTNDDGIVRLNINLNSGDYIITAQYNGCKVSNNIKVLPVLSAVDLVKKYSDNSSFNVKLVDGVGNPFKNQNIKFNINGIIFNRTTDDEGISKLKINLPAGEYIITSSYNEASISTGIIVEF